MPCCCGHHCHAWHYWGPPEPYPPYTWRYGPPPREDYGHRLEEERDLVEQRLRRLEREIEELRRVARPTPEPPSGG
jgi:hypothetical protein